MSRLLLLALAVVAIVWLLRRAISGPGPRGGDAAAADAKAQGDLVRCANCGVNLPRAEARGAGGRLYCSEDHARAGPREG